jgi:hypothetical protein
MKKLFSVLALLLLWACTPTTVKINDGIYLVKQLGYDTTAFPQSLDKEMLIRFNPDFVEQPRDYTKALVLISEFVPMELREVPKVLLQTAPGSNPDKKKLQLVLNKDAGEKLESFTANHIMQEAILVINGQALTVNKIRDTIKDGQLEITSSDNSCEKLEAHLRNNFLK